MSDERPVWLNTEEAAQYIRMSYQWLEYSRNPVYGIPDGPPFHKIGARAIRYLRSDLDEWIASRRVDPTKLAA